MKRSITSILCVAALSTALYADADLSDKQQSQSYAIGYSIGTNMRSQQLGVNGDAVSEGLKDGLLSQGKLSEEDLKTILTNFQQELVDRQKKAVEVLKEKNTKEGDAYRENNKKVKGVVTTESGLQIKTLQKGKGKESPKETDTVEVNYKGKLVDGTEFDSSYARGKAATFKLNEVIPGWTEGLSRMKVGEKAELVIPPQLGYGEFGAGQLIGPNATLIFEVELISINKPQPAQPAQ